MSDNEIKIEEPINKKQSKKDKRAETSRKNVAKARATKLAEQRKAIAEREQQMQEFEEFKKQQSEDTVVEIESESDTESDSDVEPVLYIKKPRKQTKKKSEPNHIDDRLDQLTALMSQLAENQVKKQSRKPRSRKTIVNIKQPSPKQAKATNHNK